MKPKFNAQEKQLVKDIYEGIAGNPEVMMTEEEARVIDGILKRTKSDTPSDVPFSALQIHSIKMVFEQTLQNIPDDAREEALDNLLSSVISKVSKFVK